MILDNLESKTLKWSHERGILTNGNSSTQALKLVSEIGELCDNIIKNRDVKDDIGDCLVLLTNIANLEGTSLKECWGIAWEDIKDRKGFLNEHGNFVKSTDKNYEQLKLDFDSNQSFKISDIAIIDIPSHDIDYRYKFGFKLSNGIEDGITLSTPLLLDLNKQGQIMHTFVGKTKEDLVVFITNNLKGEIIQ